VIGPIVPPNAIGPTHLIKPESFNFFGYYYSLVDIGGKALWKSEW